MVTYVTIGMKKIENKEKTKAYLSKYSLRTVFSRPEEIDFELYEFQRGEIINNLMDPLDYLLFAAEGVIRIYNIRNNGTMALLAEGGGFTVLGDIEFASREVSSYIVEAAGRVVCLSVDVQKHRSILEQDPVFLSFLLKSVSDKLRMMTAFTLEPEDLKERTLYYLDHADHQTLKGVASAASYLQCSRRQLLRILKILQEEGTVIKTGRGTYRLK
ncbi:MAG: cyclic nucleotide-binding domain-containing protein [Erysipelotrichaceae bacterium]|nr:cyclic nucleotide-binding domain-containing protein [Erysipelotrichaceae bacterium]